MWRSTTLANMADVEEFLNMLKESAANATAGIARSDAAKIVWTGARFIVWFR